MVKSDVRASQKAWRWTVLSSALSLITGCNAPDPPDNTGGVTTPGGACGRGVTVVSTDFQSANVSFLGVDGAVLSASVISSATTSPVLSAPLSGDVGVPTMPQQSDRVVVMDRVVSALAWVDVKSGAVSSQLSVATGFSANPQDYVEVAPTKVYVSRLDPNKEAGAEPFDKGSDVLIIDPLAPKITGRIDLDSAMGGEDPIHLPRPNRMVLADRRLYVLLSGYSIDFMSSAESRIVTINSDTDEIADVTILKGMHGCGGMALSPSGDRIAVSCSGSLGANPSMPTASGVVVLSRGDSLAEIMRRPAGDLGPGPVGFSIAFATEDDLLVTTLGSFGVEGMPAEDDAAVAVSIETGKIEVLLRSKEIPYSIGDVQCVPACSACFIADAETQGGVVHRFEVTPEGGLVNPTQVVIDADLGLPPRYLGRF